MATGSVFVSDLSFDRPSIGTSGPARLPRLSVTDVRMPEGDDAGAANFTVTMSRPSPVPVTFNVDTSAIYDERVITPVFRRLRLAPGQTTAVKSVGVKPNDRDSDDQAFAEGGVVASARQLPPAALAVSASDERAARHDPRSHRPSPRGTAVVADLNPVLRGWAAYFRSGNSARKFSTIDSYVHERLAIFDSRKHGRPGRSCGRRHDGAWFSRFGVVRLSGNIRRVAAHASR